MQHRRTALSTALAAVAALSLAACSSGGGEGVDPDADITQQKLTVGIWADYYPEDLAQRFEDATGVPVTIVNHATNEEAVAKVTAGGDSGIDVLFVSGQYAQALDEQGLLEPLEKSLIPNESNLYPEAEELAYDPGNTFSLPYAWGTTGLCYRPDLTGYDPTSWMDLLEPRAEVEGKTTMLSTERWLALPALKALGYSVNSEDPAELEQVKEQLLRTKSTLLAYDDTTFYDKLITGEASMVEAWDGWCNYAIAEEPQTKFVVPEEGSDLWVDSMTVLKTSKNKEAAMAFLNFILEPEQGAWVASNILYKVPNKAAMDSLDPALLEQYPNLAMTPSELAEQETIVDLGEYSTEYTRLVTEVTAG